MASDYLTLIEDFAAKPGVHQVFPVVVPLSDEKVGPQDTRHPSELAAKYDEDELEGDVWKFERDRAIAAVSRQQRLANGLRIRAAEAERDAELMAKRLAQQSVNIYWAKDDRQRQGDSAVLATSIRLQEAKTLHEEAQRDCDRLVGEGRLLLDSEKAHTAQVEGMLQQECQRSQAGWKRVEELEEESRRRLAARDCDVEKEAIEAQQRVDTSKSASQDRIRKAEERYGAQLQVMREQLVAANARCKESVDLEVTRKIQIEEAAHVQQNVAAVRLDVDLQCMRHNVADTRETCNAHVQRLQKREEHTRDFLDEWKDGAVANLLDSAGAMSLEAHRKELRATRSLEQTVHTLGQHYTTMRSYNPVVDGKISKVLGGCLHSREGETHGVAAPSTRAFPPPAPLPYLT